MRLGVAILVVTMLFSSSCSSSDDESGEDGVAGSNPELVVKTSAGELKIVLFADKAPVSTANFLQYAAEGFYNGTIFHRVIPGFMAQAGGYDKTLKKRSKGLHPPIKNEADNGLGNKRGTLAMARTSKIDSATTQFFINAVDNSRLDHKGKAPLKFGYAVFGEVVEGMDIVETIMQAKTICPSSEKRGRCNRNLKGLRDVPEEAIVIEEVVVPED